MRSVIAAGRSQWAARVAQRGIASAVRPTVAYEEPLSFDRFHLKTLAPYGTHEVWEADDLETGKTFFVKRATPTLEEEVEFCRSTSAQELSSERSSPERFEMNAKQEVALTRTMGLFAGKQHVPGSIYTVLRMAKEADGTVFPYWYVASEAIPGFISFEELRKGLKPGIPLFFIGENGETRVNLPNGTSVATFGRIASKLALGAIGETDDNGLNIGISYQEGDTLCPVVSIDHGRAGGFNRTNPILAGRVIASGRSDSPIALIDVHNLPVRRREEARREVVSHIAEHVRNPGAVHDIFAAVYGYQLSAVQRLQLKRLSGGLMESGRGNIVADILLQNGWDKSPVQAREILSAHREELQRYGVLAVGQALAL